MTGATHPTQAKTLVLLRHAKSQRPYTPDDHERPLAARGRAEASLVARLLVGAQIVPQVVLCSTARRARDTWALVASGLEVAPEVVHTSRLYGADAGDVLELLRALGPEVGVALVVGHEPTMSQTATRLAGSGSNEADLERLRAKFPTSAVAVLRVDGAWAEAGFAPARLERFTVPRVQVGPSGAALSQERNNG